MANEKKYQSANITINFTYAGSDPYLSVELDEVKNNGKTTFKFGSVAYFKVYSNAQNILLIPTDGTVSGGGVEIEEIQDEQITFSLPAQLGEAAGLGFKKKVSDNTANLSKAALESPSPVISRICGEEMTVHIDEDDRTLVIPNKLGVAIYNITYSTEYKSYQITVSAPAGWDNSLEYPVLIAVIAY